MIFNRNLIYIMEIKKIERFTYLLGSYSLIIYIILSAIVLTVASIIVQDVDYPNKHPIKFLLELNLMSFVASFPFIYVHWLRNGGSYTKYIFPYTILVIKFALFHILLQFSGFYTSLFKLI